MGPILSSGQGEAAATTVVATAASLTGWVRGWCRACHIDACQLWNARVGYRKTAFRVGADRGSTDRA